VNNLFFLLFVVVSVRSSEMFAPSYADLGKAINEVLYDVFPDPAPYANKWQLAEAKYRFFPNWDSKMSLRSHFNNQDGFSSSLKSSIRFSTFGGVQGKAAAVLSAIPHVYGLEARLRLEKSLGSSLNSLQLNGSRGLVVVG
jgi:hypothetical protein